MRRFWAVVAASALPLAAVAATVPVEKEALFAASLAPAHIFAPMLDGKSVDAAALSTASFDKRERRLENGDFEQALAMMPAQDRSYRPAYRTLPGVAHLNFRKPVDNYQRLWPLGSNPARPSTIPIHNVPLPPTFLGLLSAMLIPTVAKRYKRRGPPPAYRRVICRWHYARFT